MLYEKIGGVVEKKESKQIAGLAIILMLLLHIVAGSLFAVKSDLFNDEIITSVARAGKICVSLFAFVSGYGLWSSFKKKNANSKELAKSIITRLFKFYKKYIPFVFIGAFLLFFFNHDFSISELVKNAIGVSWNYNAAWWYVRYYVLMLLFLFPTSVLGYKLVLMRLNYKANRFVITFLSILVIVACFVVREHITGALCVPVFLAGEVCAEWDLISFIRSKKNWCVLFAIAGVVIRATYTNEMGGLGLDLVVVPMTIPAILEINQKIAWLGNLLYVIGIHSTTMWLTHSFIYMYNNWPAKVLPDAIIGWIVISAISWGIAFVWDNFFIKEHHFIERKNSN